jgi:hypothetical protein
MSLFKARDEHAGSGLDRPEPKSLIARIAEKLKATPPAPTPLNKAESTKPPLS